MRASAVVGPAASNSRACRYAFAVGSIRATLSLPEDSRVLDRLAAVTVMTRATPTLRTPRLVLVPLAVEDAAQIQTLFSQWEIVRFLDAVVPWPYPDDGARRWVRTLLCQRSRAVRHALDAPTEVRASAPHRRGQPHGACGR